MEYVQTLPKGLLNGCDPLRYPGWSSYRNNS